MIKMEVDMKKIICCAICMMLMAVTAGCGILRGQKNNPKIRLLQRLKMNLCRREQQPIPVKQTETSMEIRKEARFRLC